MTGITQELYEAMEHRATTAEQVVARLSAENETLQLKLHILTNIGIAYKNLMYIAERLAPNVSSRPIGFIPQYNPSHWFRAAARRRSFSVDTMGAYLCPRYSYGYEVEPLPRTASESEQLYPQTFQKCCVDVRSSQDLSLFSLPVRLQRFPHALRIRC